MCAMEASLNHLNAGLSGMFTAIVNELKTSHEAQFTALQEDIQMKHTMFVAELRSLRETQESYSAIVTKSLVGVRDEVSRLAQQLENDRTATTKSLEDAYASVLKAIEQKFSSIDASVGKRNRRPSALEPVAGILQPDMRPQDKPLQQPLVLSQDSVIPESPVSSMPLPSLITSRIPAHMTALLHDEAQRDFPVPKYHGKPVSNAKPFPVREDATLSPSTQTFRHIDEDEDDIMETVEDTTVDDAISPRDGFDPPTPTLRSSVAPFAGAQITVNLSDMDTDADADESDGEDYSIPARKHEAPIAHDPQRSRPLQSKPGPPSRIGSRKRKLSSANDSILSETSETTTRLDGRARRKSGLVASKNITKAYEEFPSASQTKRKNTASKSRSKSKQGSAEDLVDADSTSNNDTKRVVREQIPLSKGTAPKKVATATTKGKEKDTAVPQNRAPTHNVTNAKVVPTSEATNQRQKQQLHPLVKHNQEGMPPPRTPMKAATNAPPSKGTASSKKLRYDTVDRDPDDDYQPYF